jgi:hypothetical protein
MCEEGDENASLRLEKLALHPPRLSVETGVSSSRHVVEATTKVPG